MFKLLVKYQGKNITEHSLDVSSSYTIGSASDKDIIIDDSHVSKLHAIITIHPEGKIFIEDAGSRNGTMVRGNKLEPEVMSVIRPGDAVFLGNDTELLFQEEEIKMPLHPNVAPLHLSTVMMWKKHLTDIHTIKGSVVAIAISFIFALIISFTLNSYVAGKIEVIAALFPMLNLGSDMLKGLLKVNIADVLTFMHGSGLSISGNVPMLGQFLVLFKINFLWELILPFIATAIGSHFLHTSNWQNKAVFSLQYGLGIAVMVVLFSLLQTTAISLSNIVLTFIGAVIVALFASYAKYIAQSLICHKTVDMWEKNQWWEKIIALAVAVCFCGYLLCGLVGSAVVTFSNNNTKQDRQGEKINKWEYIDKAKEKATLFLLPDSFSYIYLMSNANTFALSTKEQTTDSITTISGISLISDSREKNKNFVEEIKTLKEVPSILRYILLFLPFLLLIAGGYCSAKLKIFPNTMNFAEYPVFVLWGAIYAALLAILSYFTSFKVDATLSSSMIETASYKFSLTLSFPFLWLIFKAFLYATFGSFIGWTIACGINMDNKVFLLKHKKYILTTIIIVVLGGAVFAFISSATDKSSSVNKLFNNLPWNQKEYLAAVCVDKKWGYIDKTGKMIIEPQFTEAHNFSEGLARITLSDIGNRDKKWGYIDKTGKIVIEPQFETVTDFRYEGGGDYADFHEGLARMAIGGVLTKFGDMKDAKYGYIDKKGKVVIEAQYTFADDFNDGLAKVGVGDGKYGYIDKKGKMVIAAEYSSATNFSEGLAHVSVGTYPNNREFYINTKGEEVFEIPSKSRTTNFSEGLARIYGDEGKVGKYGFLDQKGNIAIEQKLNSLPGSGEDDSYMDFHEGYAPIFEGTFPKAKFGYIDKTGKIVIEPKFDRAYSFSDGLAVIGMGKYAKNKKGYIDKTGSIIIEPQYDFAGKFEEGLAVVGMGTGMDYKFGYIDKTGNTVIPLQFATALPFVCCTE